MSILSFISTLLLTICIELVMAVILGYRKKIQLISIILINCITNPFVNLFLWIYSLHNQIQYIHIAICEVIVILIEWGLLVFVLRKNYISLLLLSILMNVISCFLGFLLL